MKPINKHLPTHSASAFTVTDRELFRSLVAVYISSVGPTFRRPLIAPLPNLSRQLWCSYKHAVFFRNSPQKIINFFLTRYLGYTRTGLLPFKIKNQLTESIYTIQAFMILLNFI